MTCRSAAPASVWVDDLEVKLRDRTLRPRVEGEEVSQALARDMFEIYKTGVFPRTGGWLTAVGVPAETSPGSRSSGALPAGNNPARSVPVRGVRKEGAEESASQLSYVAEDEAGQSDAAASGAPATAGKLGAALVDSQEFVSGARSFRLETLDFGSVSVVKRFALPVRVPFGVTGGNFAIGVKLTDAEKRAARGELSGRSSRGSKRDGKDGKQGERTSDRGGRTSGGRPSASSTDPSTSGTTRNAPRTGTSVKSFVQMPRAGNYYLYSFDGRLLARYDVYGFCQSEYIYMGNRLIAERDHVGNRYLYYTSDQINSTRVVTDDTGTVVYARAYDPYGGIQLTWVNSFDPTPKFSGKERDTESGLDYFGSRYYDNSQYRFISVDPIITLARAVNDTQAWNLYAYCRNNPIIYLDPNGTSYLIYNDCFGTITLYSKSGEVIGSYPAANNGYIRKTNIPNPFPEGKFDFKNWNHDFEPFWPGIDAYGFIDFWVPGHEGMGLHAHDEGRLSYDARSDGCITTTADCMEQIWTTNQTDPLEYIKVERLDPLVPECMTTPPEILPPGRDLSAILISAPGVGGGQ